MDTSDVPLELEGFTQMDEMLNACAFSGTHVYHLVGGQSGHGGHVLNGAQDISGFAEQLPRRPGDIPVLVMRRGNHDGGHKDLVVWEQHVVQVILWLKEYINCNHQFHTLSIAILLEELSFAFPVGPVPYTEPACCDRAVSGPDQGPALRISTYKRLPSARQLPVCDGFQRSYILQCSKIQQ